MTTQVCAVHFSQVSCNMLLKHYPFFPFRGGGGHYFSWFAFLHAPVTAPANLTTLNSELLAKWIKSMRLSSFTITYHTGCYPISLRSVMVWTASVRFQPYFFISHCDITYYCLSPLRNPLRLRRTLDTHPQYVGWRVCRSHSWPSLFL